MIMRIQIVGNIKIFDNFIINNFFLVDGDLSVNKLIFLSRDSLSQKTGAHLISSGPWGMIHFWNIFYNEMYARFRIVSLILKFKIQTKNFFKTFY